MRSPSYCRYCGQPTQIRIPDGDSRPRQVCDACSTVHYDNPRVVVGCVPEHGGQILICKRAIQPRAGYWTIPAGFLENGETLEQGAARECREEAEADVEILSLLAVVSIPEADQIHVFFRARLRDGRYGVGAESLETKLVPPTDIPWPEIAFSSTRYALENFLADQKTGTTAAHITAFGMAK